jgi:hypothetical protein|tara:strand:- start:859 stop:1092 length:234 start_codon:yes stop_codon:yes gene_type:complete
MESLLHETPFGVLLAAFTVVALVVVGCYVQRRRRQQRQLAATRRSRKTSDADSVGSLPRTESGSVAEADWKAGWNRG